MKNPLTPARIEPATFRFVAQHLNHCATGVPLWSGKGDFIPTGAGIFTFAWNEDDDNNTV